MAGYRRVNYYELCRLCTSSEGTKMHIFREEGRRRSLPSKIQTCLPLQVQEEDSLPKIICSSCVEKLESYFEFREACINAEAMLESYFTSLKYSDDLTREGKVSVYVKDEPPRKKDESTSTKVKIPVTSVTNLGSVNSLGDGNSIIPSAIQILTDTEGNRLTQYKVQVQGGIPSLVPYGEQTSLPLSMSIPTLTPQSVKPQTISMNNNSKSDDGTQTTSESSSAPPQPPLVATVAIAPHNQDLLQQIGLATKDRNAIAEVLKLKNLNVLETMSTCDSVTVSNSHVPGSQIGQVSNLIPAQIRLDQNQLNQLINSNLQIKLSQLQQTTQQSTSTSTNTNRDSTIQGKNVNVMTRGLFQITQIQAKGDSEEKDGMEDRKEEEGKLSVSIEATAASTMNGNNERLNNSFSGKSTNISITEIRKQEEAMKFEGNNVEMSSGLEEDVEELSEGNQQSGNNEENQSYECDTCAKTFKRKEHLFQHKKSHSGERPFVCTTCSKAFSRKEHLLRHNVSHTGQKLHTCDVCQKSFSRKDNLHKHKKTHGINGPHVCEACGKSFVFKHYYLMHKAQHENFPNTENSTGATVKYLTSTNSTTNPLPFKCDFCTKSFSVKSYLTSHRLRHRNRIKQENEEARNQDQAQSQQQSHQQSQQQQTQTQQSEQQSSSEITIPQPTILTSFPTAAGNLNLTTLNTQLTTINPNALLAPSFLHHSSANVVHIGNASYLCTPNVTSELLEQYRRIHTS